MKTLYLLRHAKAEAATKDMSDKDRPLSARGREACAVIGGYMKDRQYDPALVLSSPSTRTQETLERITAAATLTSAVQFIDKLYLATPDEILHYVKLVKDSLSSAMVVGHNPGMHHAALVLSQPFRSELRRTLELKYPTCSLTVLRFACNHWQDIALGDGELLDFITPGGLD